MYCSIIGAESERDYDEYEPHGAGGRVEVSIFNELIN